jgi:hypothetical protein
MDKAVAGPMQERGAHELCDEMNAGKTGGDIKAFDVTYFTDYEIRRMNEAVVTEAVDVGNDEFFQKVVQLAVSLGIPERNLQYGRPALVKSLRDKKMSLSNRGMIEARVDQLLAIIEKATRQAPATAQATNEGMLAEAFDALEAIPQEMYQRFNVQEPSTGPVMMAGYVGDTDAHSETVLVLGVDPEAEGRNTLRVGVDNPWSGSVQSKYFPDTREGYRDALRYAKMLRTLNLKTGGRPAEVK